MPRHPAEAVTNRIVSTIVCRMPRARQASPRRATLKDVAATAGVSLSTASLVFSGKGPVSAGTAERVRRAAAELGYAGPDPVAASLRHGRSGIVAVVVEGRLMDAFSDPFAVQVMDGLVRTLDEIPVAVLLIPRSPGGNERLLTQIGSAAFDALVLPLCGPRLDPLVDPVVARGIPIIGSGAPVDPRVPQLRVDERGACAAAASHLRELGHRRVGHVTMNLTAIAHTREVSRADLEAADYPDARDRALGVLDVFPDARVIEAARADVEHGEAAGRLLLDVPASERPTGIVAQSDLLAAGVLRAARDLGLDVPGEVSVTGFDGVDLPWLDHRLTTIVQDGHAKGRTMGSMVAQTLTGRRVRSRTFPVALRVGDTSAPAPR